MEKICIFYGASRDFDDMVRESEEPHNITNFLTVISNYNALRVDKQIRKEDYEKIKVEALVVKTDDFGSVLEHAINNFMQLVTAHHEIKRMYIQNPPKKVEYALHSEFDSIITVTETKYVPITREILKQVNIDLTGSIVGQTEAKRQIVSSIYKKNGDHHKKPVVIMLLGPSGVGKTETAKCISQSLGGKLLRIQFSMMHSNESFSYVFGGDHARNSLARDLLGRETNVILIDEFDKVSPVFYNAFYQIFDEGEFVDTTYNVNVHNAIIICTSNFESEDEAREQLGIPIFSRFDSMIKYDYLTESEMQAIFERIFSTCISRLVEDERACIADTDIEDTFLKHLKRYDNVRSLRNNLEEAVYNKLLDEFIID